MFCHLRCSDSIISGVHCAIIIGFVETTGQPI